MTSRNHLARRIPFGGMHVGTGFVGAGDTLATDCSTLKHRRGGTFSWRSTTPTSAFAPKPRGSRRISRNRPTAVDTPPCIQSARLCEPFTGTGTFVARLLQLGVIPPEALELACAQVVDGLFMRLLSRPLGVVRIRWGICRRGWCGCGGGCRSIRSRWRHRCRPGCGW